MGLPCSIRDLIPQKGKMGFDQMLIGAGAGDGQSTAIINADHLFLEDGRQLSNIALIEYINQLIAGIQGYKESAGQIPARRGLFVGLQDAEFLRPVQAGDSLTFKRIVTEEIAQVNFVQGTVERAGEKIAELVTKIYEVKDLSEFDSLTKHEPASPENRAIAPLRDEAPPACLASNLRRKLYTYLRGIEIDKDSISFHLACPDDFDGFDGHFPGHPILPGVILLEIAKLGLELAWRKPVFIRRIRKMKISGVVFPNQIISCNLKIDHCHGSPSAFAAGFKNGDVRDIANFSGSYEEGSDP